MTARRTGGAGGGPAGAAKKARKRGGGKRTERSPLTLEAVIDTARELLADDGLEALSLRGVAARMGVTAPALYAHVDDKLDLMRRLGEDGFQRLIERFEPIPHEDPLEEIREIARVYVDFARSNPELFRVMFLFPTPIAEPPDSDALLNSVRSYEMGSDAVSRAIEAGLLRSDQRSPTTLTIWAPVHGVTMLLVAGGNLDREAGDRLMESLVDSLLRGLASG